MPPDKCEANPFETLRLRAEADVAARLDPNKSQSRRPSWAPPMELAGGLLELCIKLGLLAPEDKPIARLWAQFAGPKKLGRTLREGNSDTDLAMPGISCRGFELHAGGTRGNRFAALFHAQRYGNGQWQTGPRWHRPHPYPSYETRRVQQQVDLLQRQVDSYRGEPEWENPFRDFSRVLEGQQQALAKSQADDQQKFQAELSRYELGHRVTELATARVAEFAGDYDVQVHAAGRLYGHCCECGRLLTDHTSLERGIGPECLQKVLWISPQGDFVRMVDAIADGRITAINGQLRWVAP
jgi:hypothetical protein